MSLTTKNEEKKCVVSMESRWKTSSNIERVRYMVKIGNVLIIVFATVNGTDHTTHVCMFLSLSMYSAVCMSDECASCMLQQHSESNRKAKRTNDGGNKCIRSVHNYGVNFSHCEMFVYIVRPHNYER